jgi:hypothetical protein
LLLDEKKFWHVKTRILDEAEDGVIAQVNPESVNDVDAIVTSVEVVD